MLLNFDMLSKITKKFVNYQDTANIFYSTMFALSFFHIHFPSEKILLLALFSFSENENSNVVEFC